VTVLASGETGYWCCAAIAALFAALLILAALVPFESPATRLLNRLFRRSNGTGE